MDSRTAMQLSVRLNRIGEQLRDQDYNYDETLIEMQIKHLEEVVNHCKQRRIEPFNSEAFNC